MKNLIKEMWGDGIVGRGMLVYLCILVATLVGTAIEYIWEITR